MKLHLKTFFFDLLSSQNVTNSLLCVRFFCPQGCQGSLSHFPLTLGHSLLPIHCTSHELFGVVGMPQEWALCPSTRPSKGVQFQGTTVNEAIPALAHRHRRHKTVTFPRAPPFALRTSPKCISGSFSKQFQVGPGLWQVKIGTSSTQFWRRTHAVAQAERWRKN